MVQFRLGWVWFVWFSLGWVWFVQFGGLVSKGLVWFSLVQFGLVWVGFGSVRVRFGLFGSASRSPRAQSVSHLLWPAQPRAGSRAPRPSHWPRPPCGSGALGTAGCSGTRMLWWQERNTASIRNHIPNPSAALLGSWDTQISGTASPEPAGAPGSILVPSCPHRSSQVHPGSIPGSGQAQCRHPRLAQGSHNELQTQERGWLHGRELEMLCTCEWSC